MEKGMLIGAIVITSDGDEGMVVDKTNDTNNGANYTKYVIMKKDRGVVCVDYDEIEEVVKLPGGNGDYFDKGQKAFTL